MNAPPRSIALVGLPGAGKSTTGRLLADRVGWECVDTDCAVAERSGLTPAQIIERDGEPALRTLELEVVRAASESGGRRVIACGGGVPTIPEAAALLRRSATLVWLDAPDPVLLRRLGGAADRPLLAPDPPARLAELRRARARAYAVSDVRLGTDLPPDEVAAAIVRLLSGAVRVDAPSGPYHVFIGPGSAGDLAAHLPPGAIRVVVVADQAVRRVAGGLARALRRDGRRVSLVALRGGEHVKTWRVAGRLVARFAAEGLRRGDCVVAVGGGTVGDVAGFAAAVHLRGVAWINVPTTLLAMVDSALGGKTGVNLPRGKNLAGAVWQPRAVVCDPCLLEGLSARAYRSALAEVVKYAMVFDDGLAALLDRGLDPLLARDLAAVTAVVRQSCAVKGRAVAEDEREAGPRALLNYGHTVGHALEAVTGYSARLNHGEAVAVGMRVAGALSVDRLGCPSADVEWQDALLARCGLGEAPAGVSPRAVLAAMAADKKWTHGGAGWVLLERRGRARYGQSVPEPMVEARLRSVLAA